jgi:hypothetical protein
MVTDQLSEEQWQQLCRDGVLHVPKVFSDDEMHTFRTAIDQFYESCPNGNDQKTNQPLSEPRDDSLAVYWHMPLNNPVFESVVDKPIVHNTIERMLGKGYYLSDFSMRRVRPGAGRLPYHRDNHGTFTCAILTDKIEFDEGGTTIVTQSHLGPPAPMYCMNDTRESHPEEVQATGEVGDVYFFDPDTWHGRSKNTSDRWTGIILPNFVNHSTEKLTDMRRLATQERIEAMNGKIGHALRPFEVEKANVPKNSIDRWIYKHYPTEYFFHNMFYYIRTFSKRGNSGNLEALLPYMSAMALEQSISVRRCFNYLKLSMFIRRYLISTTLNRTAVGRHFRRLIGR